MLRTITSLCMFCSLVFFESVHQCGELIWRMVHVFAYMNDCVVCVCSGVGVPTQNEFESSRISMRNGTPIAI